MKRRTILGVLLLSLSIAAGPADAALITWEFETIVRGTRGTPVLGDAALFRTGQVLTGSLTFDTATSAEQTGRYIGAVTAFRIEYLAVIALLALACARHAARASIAPST